MMKPLVFCMLLSVGALIAAQDKSVTDNIVIGQSLELSGEATGKEYMEGALAYFGWLNAQGGIHGRQIELKTYDDKRKPEIAVQNTEKLLREDKALALFGYRSTPAIEAALPLLIAEKAPMIAPFSGAQSLRKSFNPYLFHLRASYEDETAKIIDSIKVLSLSKVAILYQDDAFAREAVAGFEKHLAARKMKALVHAKYERKDLNIDSALKQIVAVDPQAVLMACTASVCVDFIRQMHKKGYNPRFLMLSNVSSGSFFKALGEDGRGVGVTQVMPYPKDLSATVTREFQRVLKGMPNPPPLSYSTLEGFVAAKLLAEGLRRAGPNPTREKLIAAMEKMRDLDLGGIKISYSPSNHDGSKFVELVVVGINGSIQR